MGDQQLFPLLLVLSFVLVGSFSDVLDFLLSDLVDLSCLMEKSYLPSDGLQMVLSFSDLLSDLLLQCLLDPRSLVHLLLLRDPLSINNGLLLLHVR